MRKVRWRNANAQNATSDDNLDKQSTHTNAWTYFVDHVSKQALDFIRVNLLLAAQANGCRELGYGDARPPGRRICVWNHSAGNEDLPQQIPEAGVMRSFKGKIDPTFDELILALL